ncbi:unnamed protein product [Merluccius merluccius]
MANAGYQHQPTTGPGDIIIGILSPCHSKVEHQDTQLRPGSFNCTGSKSGQGGRHKVTENNSIPSNWHNFLRHNSNKSELFDFLADKIT